MRYANVHELNGRVAFLLLGCWYLLEPVFSWGQYQIALDFTSTPRKPAEHNHKASFLSTVSLFLPCRAIILGPIPLFAERICLKTGSGGCFEDQVGFAVPRLQNGRCGASWRCITSIICISGRLAASQLSCNFSAGFCFPVKTFIS